MSSGNDRTSRSLYMLDLEFFLAGDEDIPVKDLEQQAYDALRAGMPGDIYPLNTAIHHAGTEALCCPECGAQLKQIIKMNGYHESVLDVASGVPDPGDFHGKQETEILCSENPSHEIPLSLQVLVEARTSDNFGNKL